MPKNDNKILPINYTNREFDSIRRDLMELAERFYPETFQDFSEASFGSLMLDAVAYVGDQLSFYLDYSVNESFLDTAYSKNTIMRHGRILGYKNEGRPSTFGEISVYLEVPAEVSSLGPDPKYFPILKRGSRFNTKGGLNFVLIENIDFGDPKNQIIVSKVSDSTGSPTHYAVKAYGYVVSGRIGTKNIVVGPFQKFRSVNLEVANLSEIISVFDSDGNEYYEVDYLSQDVIYKEIPNQNFRNDNVPSILKPMLVSRKFTANRVGNRRIKLQFGTGDAAKNNVMASPQSVAVDVFGKDYVTDTTFDPFRLSKNTNYGTVPANTTLSVTYRTNNPQNSNVAVQGLNTVQKGLFEFPDYKSLAADKVSAIQSSLEVINETPIVGQNSNISGIELKRRIFDTFPTQNRAVTQADYENLAYRLPAKFGSIKRCSTQKDPDSLKRNLNMYVISEDKFGKLAPTNSTIKSNLKTWLNHYRMINDTIDILDPYIINIGIDYSIVVMPEADPNQAIRKANEKIESLFSDGLFIGEHFQISDIYSELKKVIEILDVDSVILTNKFGGQYSSINFSINKNLSPQGTSLVCPKNAIFEIKYPRLDIRGKIK